MEPQPVMKEELLSDEIRKEAHRKILDTGDGSIGTSINNMLKSRFRILYIRSHEERRVIDFFKNLSIYRGLEVFHWDCDRGLLEAHSRERVAADNSEVNEGDPTAILAHITDHATNHSQLMKKKKKPKGAIYMLLDFNVFMEEMPPVQRKLKEFADIVSACTIVIVAPTFNCPPTLDKDVTLIDFPVPSYKEINNSLQSMAQDVAVDFPQAIKDAKLHEEDLVKAASGLTLTEVENAYAISLIAEKKFSVQRILAEKKQMIRKGGILEYRESRFTMDDLGGLDTLKEWLKLHRLAFKDDARAFGLPEPKGVLLFGIPGTGKSAMCDALAHEYQMPLLRLDFGAVFSAHVGDSEANIRECLATAEAVSPSILWIDEVEKGIGGVESSNATDGGVTNRVFGTFLTWMQDKMSPVFVVCTANNVLGIPPEFMRAGRFDEIFFIDLPDADQRAEVIEKLLKRKDRNPAGFDIDEIVSISKNYTPVEIEKGIDNALFVAYSQGKRIVLTGDIVEAISKSYPLYNSRREDIQRMREWALGENGQGGRAVLANSPKVVHDSSGESTHRVLDIDTEL